MRKLKKIKKLKKLKKIKKLKKLKKSKKLKKLKKETDKFEFYVEMKLKVLNEHNNISVKNIFLPALRKKPINGIENINTDLEIQSTVKEDKNDIFEIFVKNWRNLQETLIKNETKNIELQKQKEHNLLIESMNNDSYTTNQEKKAEEDLLIRKKIYLEKVASKPLPKQVEKQPASLSTFISDGISNSETSHIKKIAKEKIDALDAKKYIHEHRHQIKYKLPLIINENFQIDPNTPEKISSKKNLELTKSTTSKPLKPTFNRIDDPCLIKLQDLNKSILHPQNDSIQKEPDELGLGILKSQNKFGEVKQEEIKSTNLESIETNVKDDSKIEVQGDTITVVQENVNLKDRENINTAVKNDLKFQGNIITKNSNTEKHENLNTENQENFNTKVKENFKLKYLTINANLEHENFYHTYMSKEIYDSSKSELDFTKNAFSENKININELQENKICANDFLLLTKSFLHIVMNLLSLESFAYVYRRKLYDQKNNLNFNLFHTIYNSITKFQEILCKFKTGYNQKATVEFYNIIFILQKYDNNSQIKYLIYVKLKKINKLFILLKNFESFDKLRLCNLYYNFQFFLDQIEFIFNKLNEDNLLQIIKFDYMIESAGIDIESADTKTIINTFNPLISSKRSNQKSRNKKHNANLYGQMINLLTILNDIENKMFYEYKNFLEASLADIMNFLGVNPYEKTFGFTDFDFYTYFSFLTNYGMERYLKTLEDQISKFLE
ncbi:hypothetical protein GVAV_001614 [Gurleya vavrai]